MAMFDPDDPMSCVRYRIAYGEAARLLAIARFDHAWGRDFSRNVGDGAEEVMREVSMQLQRPGHGFDPELFRLAVEDAVRRRRPRW